MALTGDVDELIGQLEVQRQKLEALGEGRNNQRTAPFSHVDDVINLLESQRKQLISGVAEERKVKHDYDPTVLRFEHLNIAVPPEKKMADALLKALENAPPGPWNASTSSDSRQPASLKRWEKARMASNQAPENTRDSLMNQKLMKRQILSSERWESAAVRALGRDDLLNKYHEKKEDARRTIVGEALADEWIASQKDRKGNVHWAKAMGFLEDVVPGAASAEVTGMVQGHGQMQNSLPFDKEQQEKWEHSKHAKQLGDLYPDSAAKEKVDESQSLEKDKIEIQRRIQNMMNAIVKQHAEAMGGGQAFDNVQSAEQSGKTGSSQGGQPVRSLLEPDLVYRSKVPQRNAPPQGTYATQGMHKASHSASAPNLLLGQLPQDLLSFASVSHDSTGLSNMIAKHNSAAPNGTIQLSGVNVQVDDRSKANASPGDVKPVDPQLVDDIGRRLLAVNSVAQALSQELQHAQTEVVAIPFAGFSELVDELIKRCDLMERQALEREALAKELETIEMRLQDAQAEQMEDFEEQLESLKAECKAFKHTRDAAEERHEEYREWKRMYTPEVRQQLAARVQTLAQERKTLATEAANLRATEQKEASAVDARISRLKHDLSKVRKEAADHEDLEELLYSEVNEVEEELTKCEAEAQATADAYKEEIEEEATMKKAVEDARSESQTLKNELERAEKNLDSASLRKELAQFDAEEQESMKSSQEPQNLNLAERRQQRKGSQELKKPISQGASLDTTAKAGGAKGKEKPASPRAADSKTGAPKKGAESKRAGKK